LASPFETIDGRSAKSSRRRFSSIFQNKPERVGNSEGEGGSSALLPALKVKEFHFASQSEAV
jgi:hypothetical protein